LKNRLQEALEDREARDYRHLKEISALLLNAVLAVTLRKGRRADRIVVEQGAVFRTAGGASRQGRPILTGGMGIPIQGRDACVRFLRPVGRREGLRSFVGRERSGIPGVRRLEALFAILFAVLVAIEARQFDFQAAGIDPKGAQPLPDPAGKVGAALADGCEQGRQRTGGPENRLETMGQVGQRLPCSGFAFRPQGRGAASECGQRAPVHRGAAGQPVGAGIVGKVAEQPGHRPLPCKLQDGRIADFIE